MPDDWSHWLFVGLFGIWVIVMIVCGVIVWVHGRIGKRDVYEQPHHVSVLDESDGEIYDWDVPYDWEQHESYVPESWVKEWS